MNLFCVPDHLARWRTANPDQRGRARSLAEVSKLGRAEWGALLGGGECDQRECCP
jgi:hypothetical protein